VNARSAVIRALRPRQWPKNAVVLAAFFFALGDPTQGVSRWLLARAVAAAALFCLVSSAVYVLNDLADRARDRAHPVKRRRPIASGEVAPGFALFLGVLLAAAGLAGGAALSFRFAEVVAAYLVMQAAYTLWLKRVPLVDVLVIAAGFVLRAIAGARAINAAISPWLLLCAFLLALFLALCKRRGEKRRVDEEEARTRPALSGYDERLLDQLIAIVAAVTIACYAIYTLWPDTVAKFHTHRLVYTTPFVLFGLFRYLDLVYRHEQGDEPEHVLLTDLPTLINLSFYGAAVLVILLGPH
jgi:4-hydroxybenzoate polyprenyltransferase